MSYIFKIILGIYFILFGAGSIFASSHTIIKQTETSPDFYITFQNPSYILNKAEALVYYHCDSKYSSCKINLNLVQDSGKNLSSTLECNIKHYSHITTGVDDFFSASNIPNYESISRCNPLTQVLEQGLHLFEFKVSHKNIPANYSKRYILINNKNTDTDFTNSWKSYISLLGGTDNSSIESDVISTEVGIHSTVSDESKIDILHSEQTSEEVNVTSKEEEKASEELSQQETVSPLVISDFQVIFQRPSYITSKNSSEYICDQTKFECKVNTKIVDMNGDDISSKFSCKIQADFDIGNFNDSCNPTTFIIPEDSSQDIIFSIFEKDLPGNQISKKISFSNIIYSSIRTKEGTNKDIKIEDSEATAPQLPAIEGSNNTSEANTFKVPEFDILLQQPSYIEKKSTGEYICDVNKDECRVNIKFIDIEGKDISSKFSCSITATFDIGSNTSTCNPTTFTIAKNITSTLTLRISEKGNSNNFKEKSITILNPEDTAINNISNTDIERSPESSNNLQVEKSTSSEIQGLPATDILVQGKLGTRKKLGYKSITCYTYSMCSINFTSGKLYASEREGIRFRWDLGNGEFYNDYNPKSIKYSPGNYTVSLVVTNNNGQQKRHIFKITVLQILTKTQEKKLEKLLDFSANYKIKAFDYTNTILKEHSIDGEEILYKSFTSFISNSQAFIPYQQKSESKKDSNNSDKNSYKHVQDNFGKDEENKKLMEKKLKKNISLRISFQKKNFKIYGTTEPESHIKVFIGKQIYTGISDTSGKYSFFINSPPIGEYLVTAEVYNISGDLIARKSSASKNISQEYVKAMQALSLDANSVNKTSKQPSTKKITSKKIKLTYSIQKQAKNLKISGETLANSKLIFTIGHQSFSTYSGSNGKYTFKTNTLQIGAYKISIKVYSTSGKLLAEKISKTKVFDAAYITKMRSYLQKKTANKSQKAYTRKTSIKKITLENQSNFYSNKVEKSQGFSLSLFLLNLAAILLSILLGFIILIKRKLI